MPQQEGLESSGCFRQACLTKRPDARGREVGDNGGIRMSSNSRVAGPERRIQETLKRVH